MQFFKTSNLFQKENKTQQWELAALVSDKIFLWDRLNTKNGIMYKQKFKDSKSCVVIILPTWSFSSAAMPYAFPSEKQA